MIQPQPILLNKAISSVTKGSSELHAGTPGCPATGLSSPAALGNTHYYDPPPAAAPLHRTSSKSLLPSPRGSPDLVAFVTSRPPAACIPTPAVPARAASSGEIVAGEEATRPPAAVAASPVLGSLAGRLRPQISLRIPRCHPACRPPPTHRRWIVEVRSS